MTINWEIFTIVGILIAILTYWMTFHRPPTEEKQALLITFKANQQLSKNIIDSLFKLATEANAWNNEFSTGMTYQTAYDLMVENHEKHLSESTIENIMRERKLSKTLISSMQKSLETQQTNLQQLELALQAARKTWESGKWDRSK